MVLNKADTQKIIQIVKKEPCLVQDIARLIGKSWVTTERYVEKIAKEQGTIKIKAFRKGTKGAVKVVYWNYSDAVQMDDVKAKLYEKIRLISDKKDFDPLEIFQYADQKKAKIFTEYYTNPSISEKQELIRFLKQTKEEIFIFSGNISFINIKEKNKKILDVFEELLKRGVYIRILSRIDLASLSNIHVIDRLLKKYPNKIEIRHCRQPVRAFIIDGTVMRLKDEKNPRDFKKHELDKDVRVFYEMYDADWIEWMKNVFWVLFRNSIEYTKRIEILEKIMVHA